MNCLKRWILGKLTVNELFEYFHSMGVEIDFSFEKKREAVYYAHKGMLFKRESKK